jgi:hypothetical protein
MATVLNLCSSPNDGKNSFSFSLKSMEKLDTKQGVLALHNYMMV